MPMALLTPSPAPMPRNSPADMSTASSQAASGTTFLRKRRRPSPRPLSTSAMPDRVCGASRMDRDLKKKDCTVSRIAKVLYTAKTSTVGGRENGASRSSDGVLDIRLSSPGSARIGTNPEQLFAAGWSACFASAIALAARKRNIALPAEVSIDAEVDLNLGDGGYFLSTRLNVRLPG